jgi:DNA-binding CsgD family transcriptional regulator
VLRLLATGLSNAELVSRLFLSPPNGLATVKSHVGRILSYETGLIAPGGALR